MSIVTQTWRSIPGDYFFICTKSKSGKWVDKAFHRDDFGKVDAFIDANTDKNLYWCIHGFRKPRRKEEFAVLPKLLWADLDAVDPRKLNGTKPTLAWESSPGRFAGVWHIDRVMDKELNKRLSYSLGADKGGWDITQVLRIPGTMNYKYGKGAPGRLLWFKKDQTISVARLKQHLQAPESEKESKGEYSKEDRAAVYSRYQKRISQPIRQLLLSQRVTGDRSEILWKLYHGLLDAGMDGDEVATLVSGSVWNKFADRPKQLRREIEKVIGERLTSGRLRDKNPASESEDSDKGYITMNDVVMRPVQWVTPGWFVKGKITIVEGDPGIGKSFIVQQMCVSAIVGERFPATGQYGQRGVRNARIMYIDLENDPETDTKSRLIDMGLPEEKLHQYMQYYRPFSLTDFEDFEAFEKVVEEFEPDIIVFDTIMSYMGGSDTHKASDVQQTLSRLSIVAQDYDCAVVLIRHLGKTSRDNVKHAGLGSIAFTGMARMVHLVRMHPADEEIAIMKTIKANFCKPEPALKFHIESLPARAGRFNRARVCIDGFDLDLKDSDLTASAEKNRKKEESKEDPDKCKSFLKDYLKIDRDFDQVVLEAEKRSISRIMLNQMISQLGIKSVMRNGDKWLRKYSVKK